jgi:hypothetical protein
MPSTKPVERFIVLHPYDGDGVLGKARHGTADARLPKRILWFSMASSHHRVLAAQYAFQSIEVFRDGSSLPLLLPQASSCSNQRNRVAPSAPSAIHNRAE